MAVHLLGGGWAEDESGWTGAFVREAAQRAGRTPRVLVVLWAPTEAEGAGYHDDYRADLGRLGAEATVLQLSGDRALAASDLAGFDGLFVGGGLTPGYHAAIMPAAAAIRDAVASGVPYAGFSAGAMIAPRRALLGGWRVDGVPVVAEPVSEGLDEVTLADGLGLVDVTVDVHAAQAGTLSRAVALAAAGRADRVVAIDENTSLVVDGASLTRLGEGRVWDVAAGVDGVRVRVLED